MKLLSVLLLTFFISACGNPADGMESPKDKKEWSILQRLEYKNRELTNLEFSIFEKEKYTIAQIPNSTGKGAVYIMLNPKAPPFYKQIPTKQYNLTKEQFDTVNANSKIISTVAMAVKSHVAE